jgi:hypothetical protein
LLFHNYNSQRGGACARLCLLRLLGLRQGLRAKGSEAIRVALHGGDAACFSLRPRGESEEAKQLSQSISQSVSQSVSPSPSTSLSLSLLLLDKLSARSSCGLPRECWAPGQRELPAWDRGHRGGGLLHTGQPQRGLPDDRPRRGQDGPIIHAIHCKALEVGW